MRVRLSFVGVSYILEYEAARLHSIPVRRSHGCAYVAMKYAVRHALNGCISAHGNFFDGNVSHENVSLRRTTLESGYIVWK